MVDRIYLDTCALNRITDDKTQLRVRDESIAVGRIIEAVGLGKVEWITSSTVQRELERSSDTIRRIDNLKLLSRASQIVKLSSPSVDRAHQLADRFTGLDALDFAICEENRIDYLITTDDRFMRQGARLNLLRPKVINPIDWVQRRQPWLLRTHP
jgi:predicted nucleic acid-binding protein